MPSRVNVEKATIPGSISNAATSLCFAANCSFVCAEAIEAQNSRATRVQNAVTRSAIFDGENCIATSSHVEVYSTVVQIRRLHSKFDFFRFGSHRIVFTGIRIRCHECQNQPAEKKPVRSVSAEDVAESESDSPKKCRCVMLQQ